MQHHDEAQEFLSDLLHGMQQLTYEAGLISALFSQTAEESSASLETIGDTIARGQGVATRVLAMANSAYYGLQAEVASVSRAVAVLGLKDVRNLVLTIGVADIVGTKTLPRQFDLNEHWMHQVGVAEAARLLARHAAASGVHADPDIMYTAGLLHDIGKLLIASFRPEAWSAMQKLRQNESLDDAGAEYRYWGMDHALVAAQALAYWNLPESLTEPINWHHQPRLALSHKQGAALLFTANALLHSRQDEAIPLSEAAHTLLGRFVRDTDRFARELDERLHPDHIRELVSHLM